MPADRTVDHLLRRVAELEERVARLERGSAPTSGFAEPEPDPLEPSAHVRELLAAGRKVEAIHEYRNQAGVGLKEAKRRVEALEG